MRKLFSVFQFLILFCSLASAGESHVHGTANLDIAFEGLNGTINLESPSESIIGFEHKAKLFKDRKLQREMLERLELNISEMVQFDKELKCIITKDKIEVINQKGGHGEVEASFSVVCEKSPLGGSIAFVIQKYFPKLTKVKVRAVVGSLQKSFEANGNGVRLELK